MSVPEFFTKFRSDLKTFVQHDHTAKWQAMQRKKCLETFEPGTIVFVMDFSENFTIPYPREPQSIFYCTVSIAIHVIVLHRHAEKKPDGYDGGIVKEYHFFLSDDLRHDTEFVQVQPYNICVELAHGSTLFPLLLNCIFHSFHNWHGVLHGVPR